MIIPEGVTSLGGWAFFNCGNLSAIDLPDKLESIDIRAFWNCFSLTGFKIPPNVSSIGEHVFENCPGLERIYFFGDAPQLGSQAFNQVSPSAKIYYFEGKTGFTEPNWGGLPTQSIQQPSAATFWLIDQNLHHESELVNDPLNTGLPLLAYYALDLPLGQYRSPEPIVISDQAAYVFFGGREDVTYFVEISKDLVNWTSDGVVMTDPDVEGYRTASLNLIDGRCFVRFRFVQNS